MQESRTCPGPRQAYVDLCQTPGQHLEPDPYQVSGAMLPGGIGNASGS